MTMREAFAELALLASPDEAYAATYLLSSYGSPKCSLYLKNRPSLYYGHTWDEAMRALKGVGQQPPPDEEGEKGGQSTK